MDDVDVAVCDQAPNEPPLMVLVDDVEKGAEHRIADDRREAAAELPDGPVLDRIIYEQDVVEKWRQRHFQIFAVAGVGDEFGR